MTNYNVEYMIIANSEEKRDSVNDYLTHLSLFDEKKMKTGVKIGKKSKTQWYYRYGKRFISEGLPFYDLGPIEIDNLGLSASEHRVKVGPGRYCDRLFHRR